MAEDLCPEIFDHRRYIESEGIYKYLPVNASRSSYRTFDSSWFKKSLIRDSLVIYVNERIRGAAPSRLVEEANADGRKETVENLLGKSPHTYSLIISVEIEKVARTKSKDYHAKACMSEIYLHGIGVDYDLVKAYAWAYVVNIDNSPIGDLFLASIRAEMTVEQKLEGQAMGVGFVKEYTSAYDHPSVSIMR